MAIVCGVPNFRIFTVYAFLLYRGGHLYWVHLFNKGRPGIPISTSGWLVGLDLRPIEVVFQSILYRLPEREGRREKRQT